MPRPDPAIAAHLSPKPVSALWPLARAEALMGLRSALFRVLAAGAVLLGAAVGKAPGRGASLSAYAGGEAGWQFIGLLGIGWMSLLAVRETAMRTEAIVYSKPQPTEIVVIARFAGGLVQLLLVLAALFVGAFASRLYGAGTALGASAYAIEWARAACAVSFGAAAAYCLALLSGSVVAGALVGMAWIVMMAGQAFLAKVYFPAYSQNVPAFLAFGLALLCLAAWAHRQRSRGNVPAAAWIRLTFLVAAATGGFLAWRTIATGSDPLARLDPNLDRMSDQNIVVGYRTPGFLFPDQHGTPTTLSRFPGRVFVIALWSPHEADSAYLLDRLYDLYAKYRNRGVLPVGICISEDQGAGGLFARGEGLPFPVVTDWGSHNAPKASAASPIATAYQADRPPVVIVTDRRRRVRTILAGMNAYEGGVLESAVAERLAAEPR